MLGVALGPPVWQEAFVAVSAVLGEPLEVSLSALGDVEPTALDALVGGLRSSSRSVRAEAMARAATEVARDLERMRLR
jgi:hypothetical protein